MTAVSVSPDQSAIHNPQSEIRRVVVVGAGPGGYPAAFACADLGMNVTLVDTEPNPGGVCLYRGCIPSKALLHAAKLINEAEEAKEWGLEFGSPRIDLERLRAWKEKVVAKMTGGLGELCRKRNVTFVQGRASFLDNRSIRVHAPDGAATQVDFDRAILASGSRPAFIPHLALESPRVMNSTGALALADIPRTLLVIGGGYIGLELGSVYAALGTKVTVVEMMPSLLPGADGDLVSLLARRLEKKFASILTGTSVKSLAEVKDGVKAVLEGPKVTEPEQVFEKVLISVGRKPNSSGLGLDTTAVRVDKRGFVEVDPARRTHESSIYAIGDVAGDPMLAHKATHEGRVAAESIAGKAVAFEPRAIPAVVFTDPEIAWCGLTETEAKTSGVEVKVARFPWGASGRATTLGRNDGVTKIVVEPGSERILGVAVCGPGAGELIAEGVLAIEMGATAEDLALCIHPHPTLSETVMEAAEALFGRSAHVYRPKKP